ncbi:hypothetical protein BKP37_18315 [Anaerobacillus alkalilacustris]|uniref:SWIM-type domain-containing protein n=1 Tax=Anaerobacillus alkalilacustris TaxID=393763 RepID=A0A1S2LE25_9BACI|nr:SWIM zinc finger family protein [Anaerobacillus alkalilacustris]OIJ10490.1 hypothetical protein BKP37_18315 [Anaerobacillus alkalilacustris]
MKKKQLLNNIEYFLENYFQSRIIERGKSYFYNGNVSDTYLLNDSFSATVQGTTFYKVTIALNDLKQSHCNCPYEKNCKHMVAVLLELEKILQETASLSLVSTTYLQIDHPEIVRKHLIDDIQPYVDKIYQLLSKSGHYSNDHLEYIVKQFFEELDQIEAKMASQFKIISFTVLIDEIIKKATAYDTYRFRQNRFLAFFNELIQQGYPFLKQEVIEANVPFYEWYTSLLLDQKNKKEIEAPYEKLIATWLLCEERETVLINHAKQLLSLKHKKNQFYLTKLASLLYLQANDGASSLTLLKQLKSNLHSSELVDHFLLMEQKKDFVMMKHWFDLFFPHEKPKKGTMLGKLFEEMLIETGSEEEKLTIVWKNWLEHPQFVSYKSRIKKSNPLEKRKILKYIIPKLKADLYRPQTEATYYNIVTEEELFEEGIHSLLTHKKDVNVISPEIEKMLKVIIKKQPQLLLPFYHQLVERLVQKKSRVHYEEAAAFIKKLKIIYEKLNNTHTFDLYKNGLKQRFKTFRAFIQELNKIDK